MIRTLVGVSILIVLVVLVFSVPLSAVPEEKVTVCHVPPGNPANAHFITIGASAVPAHTENPKHCGMFNGYEVCDFELTGPDDDRQCPSLPE